MKYRAIIIIQLLFIFVLTSCERPSPAAQIITISTPISNEIEATQTTPPTPQPLATPVANETAVSLTPIPTATQPPFYSGPLSPACGQILPILATNTTPTTTSLSPDPDALNRLKEIMPDSALAALDRILQSPGSVGLVAYRVGDEANGVYLNPDMQMPLASITKLITLTAYLDAVDKGELDPNTAIPVATLEQYYLAGYDLGSHRRAINELDDNGKLLKNPDAVLLSDLPWMMIRHSSNSAADYLHLLLGQERLEETAVSLNLTGQTAPCTFIGQFLATGNHIRSAFNNLPAIEAYAANPDAYGAEVALLADAFINDATFRKEEQSWRNWGRGPRTSTQSRFSHDISPHGTAIDYANLMALFAQNGLSNSESSYQARLYLEWPMQFPSNQASFSNIGYKNGSFPGILNTAYYAYPKGDSTPIVVALFYQDLSLKTYRIWRNNLTHDEFSRWILANYDALPALKAVINP